MGQPNEWGLFLAPFLALFVALGHLVCLAFTRGTWLARDEALLPARLTLSYWGFVAAVALLWPIAIAIRIVVDT